MKKNTSRQLSPTEVDTRPRTAGTIPFGGYPERKSPAVPPPAELARVPSSSAYCFSQLCLEIKYNLPYYLRKSDLMRYLRDQHDLWWAKYTVLYEKDAYTFPTTRTASGWDYTNSAKEMLSRCKLFDSLFTQVLKLDLCHVNDFGTYCKMVFLELNKLKPAFPEGWDVDPLTEWTGGALPTTAVHVLDALERSPNVRRACGSMARLVATDIRMYETSMSFSLPRRTTGRSARCCLAPGRPRSSREATADGCASAPTGVRSGLRDRPD